jgi:hypothetical protein
MSDCLHCDINEVVREHIERTKTVDLAGLAADMAESMAELILLAPEDQQGAMLAEAIRHLGHAIGSRWILSGFVRQRPLPFQRQNWIRLTRKYWPSGSQRRILRQ